MDDLIAFFRARLDELEFQDWHTRNCKTRRRMPDNSPLGQAGKPLTCNCPVPDWLLADVGAKREIVSRLERAHALQATGEPGKVLIAAVREHLGNVVLLLAQAWSDHPDYREEWRP